MRSVQTVTRFIAGIVVILHINTIEIKGNQCLWNPKLATGQPSIKMEKRRLRPTCQIAYKSYLIRINLKICDISLRV